MKSWTYCSRGNGVVGKANALGVMLSAGENNVTSGQWAVGAYLHNLRVDTLGIPLSPFLRHVRTSTRSKLMEFCPEPGLSEKFARWVVSAA